MKIVAVVVLEAYFISKILFTFYIFFVLFNFLYILRIYYLGFE